MNLVGVKFFSVDLQSTKRREDGTETKPVYAEFMVDVDYGGNKTELRKRVPLAELSLGDYLTEEDLTKFQFGSGDSLAALATALTDVILRVIAAETGYEVDTGSETALAPTLRQEVDRVKQDVASLQQVVSELNTSISVLTKGGS